MRREYKGFYIEPFSERASTQTEYRYAIFHTVTGNLGGYFRTLLDAKEHIRDEIHNPNSSSEYASMAGCEQNQLEYVNSRRRYRYAFASIARGRKE